MKVIVDTSVWSLALRRQQHNNFLKDFIGFSQYLPIVLTQL